MHDKRRRFEAEVLPHLDAAYRFARWLSRSPNEADDLVQDAVLRAFRGSAGRMPRRGFSPSSGIAT
jgi:DNA-directed RNA polymerase specialized sigma24 family protein